MIQVAWSFLFGVAELFGYRWAARHSGDWLKCRHWGSLAGGEVLAGSPRELKGSPVLAVLVEVNRQGGENPRCILLRKVERRKLSAFDRLKQDS